MSKLNAVTSLTVRWKRLHDDVKPPERIAASVPVYDLFCYKYEEIVEGMLVYDGYYRYHTGIVFEVPEYWCGFLFPRSSIYTVGMDLANSVGIVRSDSRGEVVFNYRALSHRHYVEGSRIGQIVFMPVGDAILEEVEELTQYWKKLKS